jgi:hypothetical protein
MMAKIPKFARRGLTVSMISGSAPRTTISSMVSTGEMAAKASAISPTSITSIPSLEALSFNQDANPSGTFVSSKRAG